jgi:hypothetical protein
MKMTKARLITVLAVALVALGAFSAVYYSRIAAMYHYYRIDMAMGRSADNTRHALAIECLLENHQRKEPATIGGESVKGEVRAVYRILDEVELIKSFTGQFFYYYITKDGKTVLIGSVANG